MDTQRIDIAPGIWREGNRIVAVARVGSSRKKDQGRDRKTFALGTAVSKIEAWQLRAKAALKDAMTATPTRGSLAADIAEWLDGLPDDRYKYDAVQLLAHFDELATTSRHDVKRSDILALRSRWINAGVSKSACNRRLSRLRRVYEHFDPANTPNPTDKIKGMKDIPQEQRDIPIRIVKLILDSLPNIGRAERGKKRPTTSVLKTVLTVIAWTGMMPATLARMTSRHFDLANGRAFFTPRRKGEGADAAWIKLLPPAVDALRAFIAAGLLGHHCSSSSMGKTWRVGIKRARARAERHAELTGDRSWLEELDALPPRCRPQDLRHSFATEMFKRCGDIRAVSELLQHESMDTTKRYTKGAVSERVAVAIGSAESAFANVATIPTPNADAEKPKPKSRRRSEPKPMIGIVRAS